MSSQLVSHSSDLQCLQAEGYEIEIRANHLLVTHVPYVTVDRTVAYGTLISELSTSGNTTSTPSTHEVWFAGSIPCDVNGNELDIINQRTEHPIDGDLTASLSFSRKPPEGYPNYYEKMTTYVAMLEGPAQAIDSSATSKTGRPMVTDENESVFRYLDSATSRALIGAATKKLELTKVVIIGLGGTGSYILDLVAKTPAREIHLYDGDTLLTHNAFRAPGAASLDELEAAPKKVDYFQAKYDAMRRHIVPHDSYVDETNIEELRDASFVFLAIDTGPSKKLIIEKLEEFGLPFVDTGMGVYQFQDSLGGMIRTTASANDHRQHVWDGGRISFADEEDDDYDRNVQVADLNMLNATLAVIKWKKLLGFYSDFEHEFSSTYTIDGNHMLNEDQTE